MSTRSVVASLSLGPVGPAPKEPRSQRRFGVEVAGQVSRDEYDFLRPSRTSVELSGAALRARQPQGALVSSVSISPMRSMNIM